MPINDMDQQFIDTLVKLSNPKLKEQFMAHQYLVEASSPNIDTFLKGVIEGLNGDIENEDNLIRLLDVVSNGNATNIDTLPCNRVEVLNGFAIIFYNNGQYIFQLYHCCNMH